MSVLVLLFLSEIPFPLAWSEPWELLLRKRRHTTPGWLLAQMSWGEMMQKGNYGPFMAGNVSILSAAEWYQYICMLPTMPIGLRGDPTNTRDAWVAWSSQLIFLSLLLHRVDIFLGSSIHPLKAIVLYFLSFRYDAYSCTTFSFSSTAHGEFLDSSISSAWQFHWI